MVRGGLPRVRHVAHQIPVEPLRAVEQHPVPHEATPVVTDEQDLVQAERVHQRQHVGGDVVLGPLVRRSPRPAVAGQVRGDDPQPRRRVGQQIPVHPVVLRPPVQREHRPAVLGPGLGDVEPHAASLDERPAHAGDRRRLVTC